MKIYAPHGVEVSPGRWNSENGYTYTNNINTLTEKELQEVIQLLMQKVAGVDREKGFQEEMNKLFPEPQQEQLPKPEKPTPEEVRESKIREIEIQIADEIKAIELSGTLPLMEQARRHSDELTYLRKKLAAVREGYEEAVWDDGEYNATPIEQYKGVIPLFALEKFQTAKPLFDDFRVWVEIDNDDPVLVGRLLAGEQNFPYVIAEWG